MRVGMEPRVYPRACGGTSCSAWSLRVSGSIPARAGEPPYLRSYLVASWVYPRACGGTALSMVTVAVMPGLSPRVRGNRALDARAVTCHRRVYPRACGGTAYHCRTVLGLSPSRAGEPSVIAELGIARPWVYPRACGGTVS